MKKTAENSSSYPVALTIAGSDSGGGAGIQADLRTFNAYGVFGCSAIAAITSQNPTEVTRIDALPAAAVTAQIAAVCDKLAVRYAKTGMLFNAEIISAVADQVVERKLPLVCDPVMVSTSGRELLEKAAIRTLCDRLLPVAKWITPNLPEAELLLGQKLPDPEQAAAGAEKLAKKFGVSVILKGGHRLGKESACDLVAHGGKLYTLTSPVVKTAPLTAHGTGCTLSAAITAGLALGIAWKAAICEAKSFVFGSLSEAVNIGAGIDAMYPPTEDTLKLIKLAELK